jgi:NADH-quinone oxidoreductase subunit K
MISLWHFLAIGAVLFSLGLIGFLTRRNFITMFLCAELMLQGVVINLLAFGRYHGTLQGQVFGLFIITVAACEAGLAMAFFLVLYKRNKSLDSSDWQSAREAGLAATHDGEPLVQPVIEDSPTLPVAGLIPVQPEVTMEEPSRA